MTNETQEPIGYALWAVFAARPVAAGPPPTPHPSPTAIDALAEPASRCAASTTSRACARTPT